ncbi:MAG: AarF/UbiB family protein, partial [Burkholderiales bacterium]
DQVPPMPFEALLPEMTRALGRPPQEVFAAIEPEPRAAASIAQVHDALLPDGTPVVVKVRRPGIVPRVEADLRIMGHLAAVLESEIPESRRYQPRRVVQQFAKSLRRELDLAAEARAVERFGELFADDPTVVIPRVYWDYTSAVMNVQDRIEGIPGNRLDLVDAAGLDRRLLAVRGANVVLKMILIHGYFHADPHPGNVFYLPSHRLGLIDFGMTGMLTTQRRNEITDLLLALLRKDERALLEVILEWSGDGPVDEARLASDLIEFVFNYSSVQLRDISMGRLLSELTAIMREHHLVLPPDLTLLFKALITLEGLGRQLDPEFDMGEHVEPFMSQVLPLRYSPQAMAKRAEHGVREMAGLLAGLPRDLSRFFKELRKGRAHIDLDLKRLERFGNRIDRSASRLTLGILTASLIIGSSIVMTIEGGPKIFGMPVLGFFGFVLAVMNSIWLVFSIWRSGRD